MGANPDSVSCARHDSGTQQGSNAGLIDAGMLLEADEPPAVLEISRTGNSPFVIVVDHAGARIPRRLGNLGLSDADLKRHIAWDIGALGVARRTAEALDAPLLAQNYSRLVIDCNRDPNVASSIPLSSESSQIPGNAGLSAAERSIRRAEIFDVYHRRIAQVIERRLAEGKPTILVAQHTMTDLYDGVRRDMHAAVLSGRDRRFANLMLEQLRLETGLVVADNEPYFVSDETDYTVPQHAERRGLPYVEIEIRQDLVGDAEGEIEWAARLASALNVAAQKFRVGE
jgi:predicted N-formylglutamate amidohydrolase